METDEAIDAVQHAGVDHELGAAGGFFGGLEGEPYQPAEPGALFAHGPRDFQGDRHMAVVAAGMHHTAAARPEGEVRRLLDRQPVHVGPDQHRPARARAPDIGDHAGATDGRLQAIRRQRLEPLRDVMGGLEFFEGQLRRRMELAPMREQVLGRRGIDLSRGVAELRWHRIILANWVECRVHSPSTSENAISARRPNRRERPTRAPVTGSWCKHTGPPDSTTTSAWRWRGCWSAGRFPKGRPSIPPSAAWPPTSKTIRSATTTSRAPSPKGNTAAGR